MASQTEDHLNPSGAADTTGGDAKPQLSPAALPTSPTSPTSSEAAAAAARLHRPILQSLPDTRQQSFDEIYGPPENFLEIEVRKPPFHRKNLSRPVPCHSPKHILRISSRT